MARKFSAIMALLGMLVVLLRAFKNGESFDSSVTGGLLAMALLGIVGFVIGAIAETTVVESVHNRLERDLAERKKKLERQREQAAEAASASEVAVA